MYDGVPTIFIPIIWFEQKVETPEEMLASLKLLLVLPTIGYVSSIVILTIGSIFLFLFLIQIFIKSNLFKKHSK